MVFRVLRTLCSLQLAAAKENTALVREATAISWSKPFHPQNGHWSRSQQKPININFIFHKRSLKEVSKQPSQQPIAFLEPSQAPGSQRAAGWGARGLGPYLSCLTCCLTSPPHQPYLRLHQAIPRKETKFQSPGESQLVLLQNPAKCPTCPGVQHQIESA